jgi:hypothetical protein
MGGLFIIILAGIVADSLVKIVKHRAGTPRLRADLEDLRHQLDDQANRLTDALASPSRPRRGTFTGKMIRSIRAVVTLLVAAGCHRTQSTQSREVSIRGYGPIEAGMTVGEAEKAVGRAFDRSEALEGGCHMVRLAGDSGTGPLFMVVDGKIARVDVTAPGIQTSHTVAVGDDEAKIAKVYPERITVSPHKYSEGHYVTVGPRTEADSGFELVFETDSQRVTRYRAGRLPEVEWVEGCS